MLVPRCAVGEGLSYLNCSFPWAALTKDRRLGGLRDDIYCLTVWKLEVGIAVLAGLVPERAERGIRSRPLLSVWWRAGHLWCGSSTLTSAFMFTWVSLGVCQYEHSFPDTSVLTLFPKRSHPEGVGVRTSTQESGVMGVRDPMPPLATW